jgi:hypothetical protein
LADGRRGAGFVAEAAQEVGVLQEVGVEHFDRNAAA